MSLEGALTLQGSLSFGCGTFPKSHAPFSLRFILLLGIRV
ncbi:hypothetical protein PS723_00617 [Pseudomonas fluorescens]|uniref:Uncharacterized protein n=1 Tax=Pseudomonas fluorescens TaxID=294 RepID=A0A5E7A7R6_PSEFL|nr:hypothetical protein PS723_00617 [Pseudomonas fluorescens]